MSNKQNRLTPEERVRLSDEIAKLDKQFPTLESIEREVFRLSTKEKICAACAGNQFSRFGEKRRASCDGCGNITFYTVDTLFEDIRILRAPLFTLYLADRGVVYNANKLHEMLGIAYSTAHNIVKRVSTIALQEMLSVAHKFAEVVSLQFDGVIARRSKKTDAEQHPKTERLSELRQFVATAQGVTDVRAKMHEVYGTTDATDLYEDEQAVYEALLNGDDTLGNIAALTALGVARTSAALINLLICGLVNKLPGERYERSMSTNSRHLNFNGNPQLKLILKHSKRFISTVFDGISRRYLQLYLATYWCMSVRSNFGDNSIVNQCAKENPYLKGLKDYVSPLVVKVCPI